MATERNGTRRRAGRPDMVSWLPMPSVLNVPGPVGPTLPKNKTPALSQWQREALRRAKREVDRILLYNGLEDLDAEYSNLPKGRGLHCVNLFLYLWAKNENGYTCPLVRIPNTIIIRNGDIRFWFYMGERSEQDTPRESEAFEIKRQAMDSCSRRNVVLSLNEEIFPSKGNPNGKNSIKALHTAPPLSDSDFNTSEFGIEIDYMDQEKLNTIVKGGGLPDGVLQQHVRPLCDANVIFLCTWKPHFFYTTRITSETNGTTATGALKEGSRTTKMATGDITDMVNRRLQQTCDAIASHVYEVSPQKYRIDSMRLGFKKDHLGNLWLMFCSDLIVSKLSDSAPLISKPRNVRLNRRKEAVARPKKAPTREGMDKVQKNMETAALKATARWRPRSALAYMERRKSGVGEEEEEGRPSSTEAWSQERQQRSDTSLPRAVNSFSPKRVFSPRKGSSRGVQHRWNNTDDLCEAPKLPKPHPPPVKPRTISARPFQEKCGNSSNGKSSSFSGALRPGTAPVYTDRRHLGYDASKGQKFRVSRLGVSPMGEGAFGEEDGDAQVMLLDELYAAKELMSPYLQQYRELPKSSAESKLLTQQLGNALVEQQWNRSQDGVEAWYPPRSPSPGNRLRRPGNALKGTYQKNLQIAQAVYGR